MRIQTLVPGVTVIVGSNEAGKTTVLEFVRSVLFGFKKTSGTANIYESIHGTPRSGWITLGNGDGSRYRVRRVEKRGLREGNLSITDNAGNSVDSRSIRLPGNGLDRRAYENLFAFDLDEMRRLDRDALRGKILAAARGSVAINPLDAIKTVHNRLKNIARRPLRDGESLWSLQNRLKEIDKQIRATADTPERHSRLIMELRDIENRRGRIAGTIKSHETELRELNRVMRLEDPWMRLARIEEDILALESARDFPADGVLRLERAMERQGEARQALRETEKGLSRLRERVDLLTTDNLIGEHTEALDALRREAAHLGEHPLRGEKARGALSRSQTMLDEAISDLGPDWNRQRLADFEPSLLLERKVREFIDSWRECNDVIRHLNARHEESRERSRNLRAKILRIQSELARATELSKGFLSRESQRRLDRWKAHRHRIADLKEELGDKSRHLDHLSLVRRQIDEARQRTGNEPSRVVSPWLFWSIVLLLAGAAAGTFLAGWRSPDRSAYAYLLCAAGLWLSIPFVIRWRLNLDRLYRERSIRESDSLKSRASVVTSEIVLTEKARRALRVKIEELREEFEKIAEEELGNPHAGPVEVLKAESISSKAQEPMQQRRALEAEMRSVHHDLLIEDDRENDISRKIQEAHATFNQVRKSWNRFTDEEGLSDGMSPESALGHVTRLAETKARLRRHMADEEELIAMEREWHAFVQRVDAFAESLEDPPRPGQSPIDRVDHWVRMEHRTREILAERESLRERVLEREETAEALRERVDEALDQIDHLLNAAGVSDEESFREQALKHYRVHELELERRALLSTLLSGMNVTNEAELRQVMAAQDWHGNRGAVTVLQTALDESRMELEHLANRSGKLGQEIDFLESEDRTERLSAEKQELLSRLNRLVEEWTTLKCGSLLLEKTLRMYETDRQPLVLEKGSEIFRSISGNAFSRILFPLDEDEVKAERSDGTRVREHHLSRGTLEQVYLALRLAHLEVLGPEEPIPVMVDDILVNFDPSRARQTARALTDFADRTHTQVLFFTCHPHSAHLFPETVARKELEGFTISSYQ